MDKITGNEPAIPCKVLVEGRDHEYTETYSGMSIRQHIAAMAMQGMLANSSLLQSIPKSMADIADKIYAIAAVEHADALIAELNKEVK